jgi:O-glycosyl hydrolase
VVVIINKNNYLVNNIYLEVPSVSSVSAWKTTLFFNRNKKEVNLSGRMVALNISPKSITTIVVEK